MASEPPAPDLGALPPLTPEERRQYCSRIVYLDRPGLMRLVGRYEATVYAQAARLAAVEQERDDFRDSTYELLGELLAAHQITPAPCPGGPCVVNALLAIGHALTAAEQRATRLAAQLAAHAPVIDAVLKLSTYSRETVDAGVQRIVEALGDYEEWLLATAPPRETP